MNLEEARKVLWLKSNPRPLGELLAEGYLTSDRLEWAAQWAYSPKLKEAAKILLEAGNPKKELEKQSASSVSPEPILEIPISLDEARAMQWPFAPYKGQSMGVLVESKQLSLKDLGYAVENAWDEKVRKAATALSLVRLEKIIKEPVPSAGFAHTISGGRSYSERKQLWLTLLQGAVLGFLLGFALIMMVVVLISIFGPHPVTSNTKPLIELISSPAGIIALVILISIGGFMIWLFSFLPDQILNRLDKQIEEHRRGEEGENRTAELIIQALDGNWSLFRNIDLPGRNKGDLDIVLVGPPGVWVLEVKNFRGEYRNIGETWEIYRSKKWKTASVNPSRQALNNAVRLGNFLKVDHLNVFVNGVVVWANEESRLFVENPSIAVWLYNRLPDELGNIWQGEKISEAERKKIIEKLSKLCEEQKRPR